MNGVLIKSWEVFCAKCERMETAGRHGSTTDAAEDLRRWGWRTRRGFWVCQECVEIVPRGADPARFPAPHNRSEG